MTSQNPASPSPAPHDSPAAEAEATGTERSRSFSENRSTVAPGQSQLPTAIYQKQPISLWLKALLGIGITAIAIGGGLLWLINERKIDVPKNINTSWRPFPSQSQVSPEDAKFAEYMQKSLAKIEATNTQRTATTARAIVPAATQAAPNRLPSATAIATNRPGVITTAPSVSKITAPKTTIGLLRTLPTSNRPGAIFVINNRQQIVNVGQKIGTSQWYLLSVTKGEITVKKVGGEIRAVNVGQRF